MVSQSGHVLVLDDDPSILALERICLERAGYQVVTATSPEEACEQMRNHRIDLMVLDYSLGRGISGLDFYRQLAQDGGPLATILVTGFSDEATVIKAMRLGIRDFLPKATDYLSDLPGCVERVMRQVRTERQLAESEARLSGIVRSAMDAIFMIDTHQRITFLNPAAERMFGCSPQDIGQPLQQFIPLLPPLIEHAFPAQSQNSDSQVARFETYGIRKDGSKFPLEISGAIMSIEGRTFMTFIARDTTERQRLEKEILEISNREQQRIGQDLHDGLGQQLTGIELMSQVLARKLKTKNNPEAERAASIASMVRDTITQARSLAVGLSPVSLEDSGLMNALQQLSASLRDVFKVSCQFSCDPPVLISDTSVATHLYRIAQEATHNAVKHGHAKHITIKLTRTDASLSLTVQDDGVGIPPAVDQSRGMGLRIMNYRAGMIGGALTIKRNEDQGTTVQCTIKSSYDL